LRANGKDGNRRRKMTERKRDKSQKVKEEQLNKTDGTKYKIRRRQAGQRQKYVMVQTVRLCSSHTQQHTARKATYCC
jgi:hypothetical protein